MEKKLTDNEIIKALECCTNGKLGNEDCINCPYKNGIRLCSDYLMLDALDLINRQKAENAELQLKNSELESDLRLKTYDYEHLLMKCKEIQAISSSRKDRLMQTVINLQTAKSEAIKEVLSALETSIEESDKYIREYEDSKEQRAYNQAWRDAYNLVKEMAGE